MTVSRKGEFEVLYRSMVTDVRRYVTAHVGRSEDVEDVVNATFLSVWQRLSDVPPESPQAWVLGVARNQALRDGSCCRRPSSGHVLRARRWARSMLKVP